MSSTTDLTSLLGGAGIGADATAAMQLTVDTLGPAIQAGLGSVTLDDITTSEVVLVTQLIDDSGSIRFVSGNAQAVRDGHNLILNSLKGSKQSAAVLASCWFINDGLLYPYTMLDQAPELTKKNYDPNGGTPLFRQAEAVLTTVAAKMAEFEQGGVAARAVTVIVTDGGDTSGDTPRRVRQMVEGLLRTEQHIIAGVGVSDGSTDFKAVFREMGILDEWMLTPGNTPSEIRAAFQVVSQSAVRASQTAGSFSATALGGFGAP